MLWNTFWQDQDKLDRLHNPNYEPDSGLTDFAEIQETILAMRVELAGESKPQAFSKIVDFAFRNCAIQVNPCDWFGVTLAGWEPDCRRWPWRMMQSVIRKWEEELYESSEEGKAIQALRQLHVDTGAGWSYPDNCHSKPYWDDILTLGLPGLVKRTEYYRDQWIAKGAYTEEKRDFYESVLRVYEGYFHLLSRFADCARSKADQNEKMPRLAAALTALTQRPPETFYESLLLIYVYSVIQEYITGIQARTLGNLDTLLRPVYERELAAGTLTRDQAKELIQYFYYQYEMAGNINNQPIFFAGTDGEGHDLVNDLSYLFLEAYGEMNIISPKVQIAVSECTDTNFLRECCRLLRAGHTSFAFANEDLARRSMALLTDDEEDKKCLSLSGCYNFSLKEDVQPESAGISLVKGVELALWNGIDPLSGRTLGVPTGEPEELDSFDKFYAAYLTQTKKLVDDAVAISDYYDRNFDRMSPAPMYSANLDSAVREGKDVYFNGSKYHHTVITVSCLATAADSLYAVKKFVYDQKVLTLDAFRQVLKDNWQGHEDLRQTISNDPEKYGNNLPQVDSIAADVMKQTAAHIYTKRTWLGQVYTADGEGINHGITYGKRTGATPDGRFAHDQLSKNLQAVFGCDRRGVLAYLNSATTIDAYDYPNGAPIDFVLHPTAVEGEEGLDVMVGLIRSTFQKGGAAIQGNVYNAQVLKDAQAHPEQYRNLQVRLCGWSMYFHKLSKDEQDMLIRQAEVV